MNRMLRTMAFGATATLGIAAYAEVAGSWALTSEGRQGTNHSVLTIEQTDEGYHGSIAGQRGTRQLPSIAVDGNTFSFEVTMRVPIGEIDLTYTGTVDGDAVSGTIATPMGERPFSGTRKE